MEDGTDAGLREDQVTLHLPFGYSSARAAQSNSQTTPSTPILLDTKTTTMMTIVQQEQNVSPVEGPVYCSNPEAITKVQNQWGSKRCIYAETYKLLTGKDLEACGASDRQQETCSTCQKLPPFFIRLEWTRECPASDVDVLKQGRQFALNSYPVPDGARLVVFATEAEAKASPWSGAPYLHGRHYVYVNQHGQKAVCVRCCPTCKRPELKPVQGTEPALFCRHGDRKKLARSSLSEQIKRPLQGSCFCFELTFTAKSPLLFL